MSEPNGTVDAADPAGQQVDAAALLRSRMVAAVWLLWWIGASVWLCVELANAWPYVNSLAQVLLIFCVPGIIFRSAELALVGRSGRPLLRGTRSQLRMAAVLIGVVVGMHLAEVMSEHSMARFESALAPLVTQLNDARSRSCPPALSRLPGTGVHAYLDAAGGAAQKADLYSDGQRFVLSFRGHSIDIDGSTIFYNSGTQRWRKVHNDELTSTHEVENLVKDLALCRVDFSLSQGHGG